MKVYAVRMGDYVEFRSARRPPKAKVSKLTKVFKTVKQIPISIDDYPYVRYVSKPGNTKLTLKTVFYIGGKVLGTVKYARYSRYPLAPKFRRKGLVEVPVKLKTAILRAVWPN